MDMKQISLGLIGCGFMGRRHIAGLGALKEANMQNYSLDAVFDLDLATAISAADLAEELLGTRPRTYGSLAEFLNDISIVAVDIVTGPRTHHEIAIESLNMGKHVLCEKPLALTVKAANQMIASARANKRILATAENYRRGGANRLAKTVIDSGLLGKINLMTEHWSGGNDNIIISKWRHHKDTGAIGLDMSVHYADIIEYFLGPVDRVWGRAIIAEPIRYSVDRAESVVPTGEDSLFATMLTRSGITVQYTYIPSGPGKSFQQRSIHGTKGVLTVPPDRSDGDVVLYMGDDSFSGQALVNLLGNKFSLSAVTKAVLGEDGTGGKEAAWATVDSGYLAVELYDFFDAIQSNREPEVDGLGGLRAIGLVYAILESSQSNREVAVSDIIDEKLHVYEDEINASMGLL
jgi:predicted dehydrogenase